MRSLTVSAALQPGDRIKTGDVCQASDRGVPRALLRVQGALMLCIVAEQRASRLGWVGSPQVHTGDHRLVRTSDCGSSARWRPETQHSQARRRNRAITPGRRLDVLVCSWGSVATSSCYYLVCVGAQGELPDQAACPSRSAEV